MKVSFTKNQNNWLWNTLVKRRHVILIEKNKFLNEKIALLSSGKTEDYVKRHMITFPKSINEERSLIGHHPILDVEYFYLSEAIAFLDEMISSLEQLMDKVENSLKNKKNLMGLEA